MLFRSNIVKQIAVYNLSSTYAGIGSYQGTWFLNIFLQFVSKETVAKTYDVDCYFTVKQGCRMTLYQVPTKDIIRYQCDLKKSP